MLRYVGLGIPTIVASFRTKVDPYDFAAKSVLTGDHAWGPASKGVRSRLSSTSAATLGNALSNWIPLPASLLAGMGFVAVFSGAANTPIASTFMAVELFGAEAGSYAGIACVLAYLFSGHVGIYSAQRLGKSKHRKHIAEEGLSLAVIAKSRAELEQD